MGTAATRWAAVRVLVFPVRDEAVVAGGGGGGAVRFAETPRGARRTGGRPAPVVGPYVFR